MKTKSKKNICPKCGGNVVAEAIGNYGTVHYIKQNGEIGRALREYKYEHSGEWMYYCTGCGENFERWPLN